MHPFEHMAARATRGLTHRARPVVRFGTRSASSFVLFVGLGFVAAGVLATALALDRGLWVGLVAGLGVLGIATEGGLALLRRALFGTDRLVFYESFLAIAGVASLFLWILGQPILPYLEVLLLGVGVLQAVGRLGCFMVGCCHGRPAAWGVCYRHDHAAAGFDPYLVGVPLVPVQLIEMVWALGSVALGSVILVHGAPPGSGLATYVVGYGLGRFVFEFARGDAARPYLAGFSEAQWLALLVTTAVVVAEAGGVLPPSAWHQGLGAGLIGMAGLVLLKRRTTARHRFVQPEHVGEMARAVRVLQAGTAIPRSPDAPPHVVRTSLGVSFSGEAGDAPCSPVQHYTVTLPEGTADAGTARTLTRVVRPLLRPFSASLSPIECTGEADGAVRIRLVAGS